MTAKRKLPARNPAAGDDRRRATPLAALRDEIATRNQALVEILGKVVYDWHPQQDRLEWDGGFSELLGYSAEAMGKGTASRTSRIHPADLPAVLADVGRALDQRRPYDLEYRFRHRDGHYVWVHDRGVVLPDAAARLERIVGVLRDVSSRHDAEQELRASEIRYRTLAETLNVLVYRADPQTLETTFVNQAVADLYGYTPAEFLANPRLWENALHPDDIERVLREFHAAQKTRAGGALEYRILHRNGGERWVVNRFAWEAPNGGPPVALVGTVADITARKQAQESLANSEAHYREVFEQATDGILIADPESRLLDANPAVCRMFGYSLEELRRLSIPDVIVPGEHERIGPETGKLATGKDVRSEWHCRRRDGSEFIVEVNARRLPDGRLQGFLRDMTERNRIKDDLRRSVRRMHALARRLVELQEAGQRRMSAELHDRIGQNLTALALNLDLVGAALPPATVPALQPRLRDSRELLEQTIRSVRSLVTELRPAVLEDYGLLAGLRAFSREYEARTGIATAVTGDEPVPRLPPPVELALYRIAQEALTNTAKHARARHVTLRLEGDRNRSAMTVNDDGAGFEPEATAEGSRTRWGLQLMQERAEAVGGRLQVTASPGSGTHVRVDVPRPP